LLGKAGKTFPPWPWDHCPPAAFCMVPHGAGTEGFGFGLGEKVPPSCVAQLPTSMGWTLGLSRAEPGAGAMVSRARGAARRAAALGALSTVAAGGEEGMKGSIQAPPSPASAGTTPTTNAACVWLLPGLIYIKCGHIFQTISALFCLCR